MRQVKAADIQSVDSINQATCINQLANNINQLTNNINQLANNIDQLASASTQTDLQISDNDLDELCHSMAKYNNNINFENYYTIPTELVQMNDSVIYEVPNCDYYEGISTQTDLSLSFLDLTLNSDPEDDDGDVDFSGSDDYDERRISCRHGRNDVISVINEDDEEDDDDANLLMQDVGSGQFMLDLLDRINPSTPPTTDSSSSNECTPTSSKGTSTTTSSASSSSSHSRCLEFDSASSPNSEESAGRGNVPAKKKSKLKRPVPRMGTRLDIVGRPTPTPIMLDNLFFPPPPPPPISSSSDFQTSFQSPIPCRHNSIHHPPSPSQQHVYQDLVFDLPETRNDCDDDDDDDAFNNNHFDNSTINNESFYHILSSDQDHHQCHTIKQLKKNESMIKSKLEHRVTFDLMRSSDEDIYENDYEVKTLLKDLPLLQLPPPLPKRPSQVKFTPIFQNSSSDSTNASPIFLRHSNQVAISTLASASVSNEDKCLRKHVGFPQERISSKSTKIARDGSCENRNRMESIKFKNPNNGMKSNDNFDKMVVVIGEEELEGSRCEAFGKLTDILCTNKTNLRQTMMLQQKLFQQQLQSSTLSHRPKSQLVPNSQNLKSEQVKQNPWGIGHQQNHSPQPTDWVIKRRQDGTRYITRRNKISKAKDSRTPQRDIDKNSIPRNNISPPQIQTVMPIFRAKRIKETKAPSQTAKENNKYPIPTKPMMQVDSFAALQNVLQSKMSVQNHLAPQKQNLTLGKPLLSVTSM